MISALLPILLAQTQKTPDGSAVSLLAITNIAAHKSWKANGAPIKDWVFPDVLKKMQGKKATSASSNVVNFVAQIKGRAPEELPSVKFRINGVDLGYAYTLLDLKSKGLWWAGAGADTRKVKSPVDLKIGVATGAWKTTGSHDLQTGLNKGKLFFASVDRPQTPLGGRPHSWVVVVHVPAAYTAKMATRVKIFDLNGNALQAAGSGPSHPHGEPALYFVDNGKRLIRAELQARPYTWLTFKGVKTTANAKR